MVVVIGIVKTMVNNNIDIYIQKIRELFSKRRKERKVAIVSLSEKKMKINGKERNKPVL